MPSRFLDRFTKFNLNRLRVDRFRIFKSKLNQERLIRNGVLAPRCDIRNECYPRAALISPPIFNRVGALHSVSTLTEVREPFTEVRSFHFVFEEYDLSLFIAESQSQSVGNDAWSHDVPGTRL